MLNGNIIPKETVASHSFDSSNLSTIKDSMIKQSRNTGLKSMGTHPVVTNGSYFDS